MGYLKDLENGSLRGNSRTCFILSLDGGERVFMRHGGGEDAIRRRGESN